jgi:serine/threonine protein kinase
MGISRLTPENDGLMMSRIGTPKFMAPEIHLNIPYTNKVIIFI